MFAHTRSHVHIRELDLTAAKLVAALLRLAPERNLSLLDGGAPANNTRDAAHANRARYLIAGFDPFETIERSVSTPHPRAAQSLSPIPIQPDTLTFLDERLRLFHQPRTPHAESRFSFAPPGACIAAFPYELTHEIEQPRIALPFPLDNSTITLRFYDSLVIHDYQSALTYISSIADASRSAHIAAELCALTAAEPHNIAPYSLQPASLSFPHHSESSTRSAASAHTLPARASSNFTADEYAAAVLRIQEHIRRGDIYQANLTQQITCPLLRDAQPADIYQRLRRAHPARFGAYMPRQHDTIVSISPERFLRVRSDAANPSIRRVEAAPIKGTRRRGATPEADARLRAELAASSKDKAENVMIVDLMRNDIGRVCRYGSIHVKQLCRIEQHPTLFHLVSIIEGTLRPEISAGDLLRAAFPCGSITGAPKIRATEIISEIEQIPRGISMGSIGYFSFDGMLDLNVAIRTITFRNRIARFNVGGGIVIDSRPADEYAESLTKARALLAALQAEVEH